MATTFSSHLTADSVLLSTTHDRQRRAERQIQKITLQAARRYGMAEKANKGRIRYTYAGHVFIYDPKSNRAITSWKVDPNYHLPVGQKAKKVKEATSGTKFFKPILIQKSLTHESAQAENVHTQVGLQVQNKPDKWTSHTVLVVDMSGSMKEDDVNGARCRADGVWTTLARDFVKKQLELKITSVYDVVSVIVMRTTARVVVECEPITYVLYNKLVDYREWDNMRPKGHGNYGPALAKAEQLLSKNPSGSCALMLMFFSDGKPSDFYSKKQEFSWERYSKVNDELVQAMGQLGSKFGRRLTIACVGMAGQDEKFGTLERMANEASMFGCNSTFHRPDMEAESLSKIVTSSLASSLSTKTEMTSVKTKKPMAVRTDVERERKDAPEDMMINENWRVFVSTSEDAYVQQVWTWNANANDFATIIDPRCFSCYKPVANAAYNVMNNQGSMCKGCQACFFCTRCMATGALRSHQKGKECKDAVEQRRSGFLVGGSKCPPSFEVAWKKQAFGEGAERLAFKFRFVNKQGVFVGPVMVAKESRFVEDVEDAGRDYLRSDRRLYHKSFMRTQATASKFATMFNTKVQELEGVNHDNCPSIEFLEPHIFELEDRATASTYNFLWSP